MRSNLTTMAFSQLNSLSRLALNEVNLSTYPRVLMRTKAEDHPEIVVRALSLYLF
ncbi:hypothetical protein [Dysgonomonas sp.]|jgi:hypothetical protein